jgi:hypothetical protein
VQEAISKAVASAGRTTGAATKKSLDYAQMANRGAVQPYMFDDTGAKRHLLQSYQRSDQMQMAGMAAQVGCVFAYSTSYRTTHLFFHMQLLGCRHLSASCSGLVCALRVSVVHMCQAWQS